MATIIMIIKELIMINKQEDMNMKYYGNQYIKKAIKVGEVSRNEFINKNSAVGFIKEHGLLGEYISKMDGDDEYLIDTNPKNKSMEYIEYNGEKYWYGENIYDEMASIRLNATVGFYAQLPDIYNDKVFHWKKNKKYGSMECTIEEGVLAYQCIYKADGNANVNVRYVACDNLHRNKVTIATIEVEYATNEVILKAIKEWKRSFKDSLKVN